MSTVQDLHKVCYVLWVASSALSTFQHACNSPNIANTITEADVAVVIVAAVEVSPLVEVAVDLVTAVAEEVVVADSAAVEVVVADLATVVAVEDVVPPVVVVAEVLVEVPEVERMLFLSLTPGATANNHPVRSSLSLIVTPVSSSPAARKISSLQRT